MSDRIEIYNPDKDDVLQNRQRDEKGRFKKGSNFWKGRKRVITEKFRTAMLANLEKAKQKRQSGEYKGWGRKVVRLSVSGEKTEYYTARCADREMGYPINTVSHVCGDGKKSHWFKGYYWYYEDDKRWIGKLIKLKSSPFG